MTTVIYHSADFDGIFCREIARKFLGEKDVQFIGWNFGDQKIDYPPDGDVYVMDLSPECFKVLTSIERRPIWIDHHKTSIDRWPSQIPGYRIDGVAACRLAWQWFYRIECQKDEDDASKWPKLPEKQSFIDRRVYEPMAVRLAGEYDVWDKRDPNAERFQYGLRTWEINFERLLSGDIATSQSEAFKVCDWGSSAQRYAQKTDEDLVKHRSYQMEWEGLKWIVLNTGKFNSLTFAAKDVPETGHDALLGYMFNGKIWTVSLYHARHRTDLDLSKIAVKHGGGGHRGACGFTCSKLPFI